MEEWQVFYGGSAHTLRLQDTGVRLDLQNIQWSQIQRIDYPSGFGILLCLRGDAAQKLDRQAEWAIGFRSSAEQRSFRTEIAARHRALEAEDLPWAQSLAPDAGRGLTPGFDAGELARLNGLVLVGGYDYSPLVPGRSYSVAFSPTEVAIQTLTRDPVREFAYGDIIALEVAGPGEVKTGGGFIGGGFGLTGAAEGMLVASVLNSLTTRTSIESFIELQDTKSYYVFLSNTQTPAHLNIALMPVRARLRANAGSAVAGSDPKPGTALVDQLERLSALHTVGALTDVEFDAAKRKLLG